MADLSEQLANLQRLYDDGSITRAEYDERRAAMLEASAPAHPQPATDQDFNDRVRDLMAHEGLTWKKAYQRLSREGVGPPPRRTKQPSTAIGRLWSKPAGKFVVALAVVVSLGVIATITSDESPQPQRSDSNSAPASTWEQACPGESRLVLYNVVGPRMQYGTGSGTWFSQVEIADITYSSSDGGTRQDRVGLPTTHANGEPGFGGCYLPGSSYYISAQKADESAPIQCEVAIDGVLVSDNTSSGDYAIVTCSGSVP